MPLTERDPNISGRNSRASNLSATSRGYQKANMVRTDLLSAAPGVMSMLRTSTELGDVGTLAFDSSHLPSMPRLQQRRSGATSRMSTSSSHSQASRRTTNHNPWPSASSNPRGSLTRETLVPQFLPDTLSPTLMNIPGMSPLVPHSRVSRDGRSFSLTHASQPPYPLSSNRSYTSLRHHDYGPRPRSPYRYPTRLRHPAYRPASPAMSDVTSIHSRRVHGHPLGPRLRTPSIQSTQSEDRNRIAYYQGRNRSNTASSGPSSHPSLFIEQVRRVRTPALGSSSSGSTNRQTDSEAPSSNSPSSLPPTPKDGGSMEVLLSPIETQVLVDHMKDSVKSEVSPGPLYYDYSEHFDRDALSDPEPETIPMGFVHRIKTILEERGTSDPGLAQPQPQQIPNAEIVKGFVELPASEVAELPASPVIRRITRHMVLAAIEPSSTTDETSTLSALANPASRLSARGGEELDESCTMTEDAPTSAVPEQEKHQSVVFQSASKDSNSSSANSTIDFAITHEILMADKMDEEQTEIEKDIAEEQDPKPNSEGLNDRHPSIKTAHSSQVSDAKSFKSCKESDAKSTKDSDGKAFKTARESINPKRGSSASVPTMISRPFSRPASKPSLRPSSATLLPNSATDSLPRPPSLIPVRESSSSREAQRSQAVADFLMRLSRPRRFTRQSFTKDETMEKKTDKMACASKDRISEMTASRVESLVREEAPKEHQSNIGDFTDKEVLLDKRSTRVESMVRTSISDKKRARAGSLFRVPVSEKRASRVESFQNVHTHAKGSTDGQSLLSIGSYEDQHSRMKSAVNIKEEEPYQDFANRETAPHSSTSTPVVYDVSPLVSSIRESSSTPCPFTDSPSAYVSDALTPPSSEGQIPASESFPAPPDNGRRDSNTTTHLVWNPRKTLPPISIEGDQANAGNRQSQDESTTDLRLSTFRYPAAYLPDVKEDLHEDSSVNTSISNMKSSTFGLPVGRIPSMRVSMDECRVLKHSSNNNAALARTRNLPSLNFSQMDLFSKLNDALESGAGVAKSIDYAKEYRELFFSPLDEPHSVGEMREKYKSLFGSLDESDEAAKSEAGAPAFDLVVSHQSTMEIIGTLRPFSRDELIAEVDNLTIPSLGGLTQRLSEFLPSLKRYYQGEDQAFDDEDIIMEHVLEELNELGAPMLNTVRSSARLRPVPGQQHLLVVDDGTYEKRITKEPSKGRLVEVGDEAGDSNESVYSKRSSRLRKREKTPLAELEAPMPTMLRTRSLSLSGMADFRASYESKLSRRSLRSLISSPTETRPWNLDKNYPWADTDPPIDISLPAPALARDPARPGPSRLRLRMSGASSLSESDYGAEDVSPVSVHEDTTSDDPFRHTRKSSKHSIIGSITRRIGLRSPPFDHNGYPTGPDSLRNDDRSVDPGDRYPTTGLTPPSAFNIEEVRSFFSDDSSHRHRSGTFRKRLTHLKARLPPVTRSHSAVGTHSLPDRDAGSISSLIRSNSGGGSLHTFDGTVGMTKMQFRARKVVERIKTLWFKGGDLFRSMSGRQKTVNRSEYSQDSEVYLGT